MKASELTSSSNPIIAHIATKLHNEGKGNWNYYEENNHFVSPDSTRLFDITTLEFHIWNDDDCDYIKQPSENEIKTGYQKIELLVNEAYDKLHLAQKLADEFGLDFRFKPTYGMGGTYYGKGTESYDSDEIRTEGEWQPSSHNC